MRGFVDRIEGDVVVILIDDFDEIVLPLNGLPDDITEGDVVQITITRDTSARNAAEQDVADIQDRLRNRS